MQQQQKLIDQLYHYTRGAPFYDGDYLKANLTGFDPGGNGKTPAEYFLEYVKESGQNELMEAVFAYDPSKEADIDIKPLPTVSLAELLDGPTTIDWLVEPIMPPGTSGFLIAPGGTGKTWLALDLILSVASGKPWLGEFETKRGPVLVVDQENADLLLRIRLGMMLRGRGLKLGDLDPIHFFVGTGVDLSPERTAQGGIIASESYHRLVETVRQTKPVLIVFDSLTRCHTSEENSSKDMSSVFNHVKAIADQFNCVCLFTHHTNKQGGYRGSTDIYNFGDWSLQVEKETGQLAIEQIKARWCEAVKRFAVLLDIDEIAETAAIEYSGESAKQGGGKSVWRWLEKTLAGGKRPRKELVKLVKADDICGVRKLDDVLKWGYEVGKLGKERVGKEIYYYLIADSEAVQAAKRAERGPVDVMAEYWAMVGESE